MAVDLYIDFQVGAQEVLKGYKVEQYPEVDMVVLVGQYLDLVEAGEGVAKIKYLNFFRSHGKCTVRCR